MTLTSNCFHLMIHLFIIEDCFFIVFMLDVFFNDILFYTFSCLTYFLVIFDIAIHLRSQTSKFTNGNSSSFIFKFTNYFLIGLIKIWRAFWIVTVIEFIFIIPKVLIYIFSFNFICQAVCVCE